MDNKRTDNTHYQKNISNIMIDMFDAFNAESINYCVFKSTMNLRICLCARNDFDVLVSNEDRNRVISIFDQLNIKRFETPSINNYVDVENWLAFDENSGCIYHIHLHYTLITGMKHVKEFYISWENQLLTSAKMHEQYNIRIADEKWELLLLITRIVLKSGKIGLIQAKKGKFYVERDMLKELEFLIDRIDKDEFYEIVNGVYTTNTLQLFKNVVKNRNISGDLFVSLYNSLNCEKSLLKTKKMLSSIAQCGYQEIVTKYSLMNKQVGGYYISKKRGNKGLAIAFVGVDGSGKSQLTRDIYNWLSPKIETQKKYLGSGDGQSKLIKHYRNACNSFWKMFYDSTETYNNDYVIKINKWLEDLLYLYVAVTNRGKIMNINRYRNNRGICIIDRYPQLEQRGVNDGPKIDSDSILVIAERRMLEIVKDIKPDVIFRLRVSEKTSLNRKKENRKNILDIRRKISGLSNLSYEGAKIIDIDAEQPYSKELIQIKKIIWSML